MYEVRELEIQDLNTLKVYTPSPSDIPVIRCKGMDTSLNPIFEITFIGKEKENAKKEQG